MNSDNKRPLTPKLRFPEFRDEPAWTRRAGSELFGSITNRAAIPGLPVLAVTQEHGAVPRDEIDYHVSVTDESVASYKEVCVGDFVISLRSFQGGIEYSRHHGICSPAYVILRRKGEGSDDYFRYLFKTDRFIQQLTRNIEGLRDGKMITYQQFSEQLLPSPEPAEQQKIAECLTSLDELISAHSQKLDALKSNKKALMQQLFPDKGETIPRLRFPEFAGNWKEKKLEMITESISSGRDKNDSAGTYDLHGSTGVIGKTLNDSYSGEFLLVARVGANAGLLTKAKGKFGVTDNTLVIQLKRLSDIDFTFYYLDSIGLNKLVFGSGQPLITGGQLKELTIHIPDDAECKKVAECLSSIDEIISAQSKKLAILTAHKRGLMQQLFPSQEKSL